MRNSDVAKVIDLLTDMDSKKDIDLAIKIINILEPDEKPYVVWPPYEPYWNYPTITWTGGDTTTTTSGVSVTDKIFFSDGSTATYDNVAGKKSTGI